MDIIHLKHFFIHMRYTVKIKNHPSIFRIQKDENVHRYARDKERECVREREIDR